MKALRPLVWLAGAGLCALLLAGVLRGHRLSTAQAVFDYGGALVALTIGILVWRRRADSSVSDT